MPKIFSFALLLNAISLFASEASDQTKRLPQIENEQVKVWKTVIMPNQPLKMHRHDASRVIVPLTSGTLEVIEDTGERHDLVFQEGKPMWLEKDLPGTLHADINHSDKPIEVIVIEMRDRVDSEV